MVVTVTDMDLVFHIERESVVALSTIYLRCDLLNQ